MLPLSRNTNYTQGAQIKSADLNDLQDMIIAGKHGEVPLQLNASHATIVNGTIRPDGNGYLIAQGFANFHVPTFIGTRIKSIRMFCKDSPGVAIGAVLFELNMNTGGMQPRSTETFSDASGNNQSFLLADLSTVIATSERRLHIAVVTGATNHRVYGVTVVMSR